MSEDLVLATLRESALLAGLEHALPRIQPLASLRRYPAGTTILVMGEEVTSIFLVAQGTIALTLPIAIRGKSADVTIEEKEPGAVLAWSALVPPHKLTLSARAASDATLIGLPREGLQGLFADDRELKAQLMGNLCGVIGSRVSLLEALLMRDLQRWVAERA